jgi:hypothetical protein
MNSDDVVGRWVHAHEQDTDDEMVFVRDGTWVVEGDTVSRSEDASQVCPGPVTW